MQPKQDIKGFTILELLVVIIIIGVISSIGYPNFMDWKKEREVRSAAVKIEGMIKSILTQSQNGYYPFTQLLIVPSASKTSFYTKGITQENFSNEINSGNVIACKNVSTSYWTNHSIDIYETDKKVHISSDGAVCFSKDGSYYKTSGDLTTNLNITLEGLSSTTNNYIIFCHGTGSADFNGIITTCEGQDPAYLVNWSRFGSVSTYKWRSGVWIKS